MKGANTRGSNGGECGRQLFNKSVAGMVSTVRKKFFKICVTMLVDINCMCIVIVSKKKKIKK